MTKSQKIALVLILLLAIFMRFYNLPSFQYFTGDEEIFHHMLIRATIDGRPPLVIPNAQIGGSMGSLFILLISPISYILQNDPLRVQIVGPILGVITTFSIFWVGRLIGGNRLGLIAALLYAGSFLIAIFDRRLWTLTLDPLMMTLAIGSLVKILQKDYRFFLGFTVAGSFAWHSDPAIAVVWVAYLLTFFIFKIPFFKKEFLSGYIYLFISLLPLIFFELRHPGTIIKPWLHHLTTRSSGVDIPTNAINFFSIIESLSRGFFSAPQFVEQYFCYCSAYPKPPISPLPEILTISIILVGVYLLIRKKDNILKMLLIFLASFLIGATLYSLILSFSIYQHYFMVIYPAFLLLTAIILEKIFLRFPLIVVLLLASFIFANMYTLFHSTLEYPLTEKEKIVKETISEIKNTTFSIYGFGKHSITDGGWVYLYTLNNTYPNKSYLNGGWDFIYRTHSLYRYNPENVEGDKIIIFHDSRDNLEGLIAGKNVVTISNESLSATILDNKERWFSSKILDELQKGYQIN